MRPGLVNLIGGDHRSLAVGKVHRGPDGIQGQQGASRCIGPVTTTQAALRRRKAGPGLRHR